MFESCRARQIPPPRRCVAAEFRVSDSPATVGAEGVPGRASRRAAPSAPARARRASSRGRGTSRRPRPPCGSSCGRAPRPRARGSGRTPAQRWRSCHQPREACVAKHHAHDHQAVADGPVSKALARQRVADRDRVAGSHPVQALVSDPSGEVAEVAAVVPERGDRDLTFEVVEPALGPLGEGGYAPGVVGLLRLALEPGEVSQREAPVELVGGLLRERLVARRDHDAPTSLHTAHHPTPEHAQPPPIVSSDAGLRHSPHRIIPSDRSGRWRAPSATAPQLPLAPCDFAP